MKIFTFLFSFNLGVLTLGQAYYPEAMKLLHYDLQGPVRSLVHDDNCVPERNGMYARNDGCTYIADFNRAGFLTSVVSRDSEGAFEDTMTFTFTDDSVLKVVNGDWFTNSTKYVLVYDDKARFTWLTTMHYYGNIYEQKLEYDDSGNVVFYSWVEVEGKKHYHVKKIKYEYDTANRLILEQQLDYKNKPFKIVTQQYSTAGNLIATKTWNRQPKKDNGAIRDPEYQWRAYTYDEQGNIIADSFFVNLERVPLKSDHFDYNENNQLILAEYKEYYFRNSHYTTEIEYDSLSRKIQETSYQPSGMYQYTLYAYNAEGLLDLEEKHESTYIIDPVTGAYSNGWKITRRDQYEYDHYGNWIKKYYLDYDGTEKVATREITYYE